MKIKRLLFFLIMLTILLSGCSKTVVEYPIEFSNTIECNESITEFFELKSVEFPENIDHGYLYSYVFDYGQFIYIFHNPDSAYAKDEFVTRGAFGNQFHNDDGAFLKTEIPDGYYLYDVTYKYTSSCREIEDETKIALNLDKSFLYYSEETYSEVEFKEAYPDMFE